MMLAVKVGSYLLSGIGLSSVMDFFDDDVPTDQTDFTETIMKSITYLTVLVVAGFGAIWYFKKGK